jgi:hypothetical protein
MHTVGVPSQESSRDEAREEEGKFDDESERENRLVTCHPCLHLLFCRGSESPREVTQMVYQWAEGAPGHVAVACMLKAALAVDHP